MKSDKDGPASGDNRSRAPSTSSTADGTQDWYETVTEEEVTKACPPYGSKRARNSRHREMSLPVRSAWAPSVGLMLGVFVAL
ncbi:hypothetical protein HPB50_020206 [Hyalomma asiaticum]|uniref:Uncharacterized protein n=1 Tax=Hyalomma asiaticum TaxID=266040 RepID=A0ACB7T854_HYAAI|nr:hypothetical protein HPB50_020206 [Hyalomma asiaticum]